MLMLESLLGFRHSSQNSFLLSPSFMLNEAASFFIFVNSIAGLAGHFLRSSPTVELIYILPLIAIVIFGGQLGSRITTYKLQQRDVKLVTAILVFIAGVKILIDHL